MALPHLDRTKAAYAASQPLLDSLLVGESKLHDQQDNLTIASDLVRQIHVHVPSATNDDGEEKQQQYLDAIVKAWRSATEVYDEVFGALVAVTAPDPTVGREAAENYHAFKRMAESARDARRAAYDYKIRATEDLRGEIPFRNVETRSGNAHNGKSKVESKEKSDRHVTSEKRTARAVDSGHNSSAERINGHADPQSTKSQSAKRRKRTESHSRHSIGDEPVIVVPAKDTEANHNHKIEYEDVSAEVEARLRKKEEERQKAKQLAKAEKKRKRESVDSAGSQLIKDSGVAAPREKISMKPSKKKAKNQDVVAVPIGEPAQTTVYNDKITPKKNEKRKLTKSGEQSRPDSTRKKAKRSKA